MGTSTDAILFFGFLPENYEYFEMPKDSPFRDLYDAVEAWNKKHRPPQPEGDDYQSPAFNAWRTAEDKWKRTSATYIVQGSFCCNEDAYPYIAIERLCTTCNRGYVEEIPMDLLTKFTAEDLNQMTQFCKFAGIPYPDGCSWKLVSWRG